MFRRPVVLLSTLLLTLLALLLILLFVGALASLNAALPPTLLTLAGLETLVSARLPLHPEAFVRALIYALGASLGLGLATYLPARSS